MANLSVNPSKRLYVITYVEHYGGVPSSSTSEYTAKLDNCPFEERHSIPAIFSGLEPLRPIRPRLHLELVIPFNYGFPTAFDMYRGGTYSATCALCGTHSPQLK